MTDTSHTYKTPEELWQRDRIMVDALAEIMATNSGESRQSIEEILEGCNQRFDILNYSFVTCGEHYSNIQSKGDNRVVFCKECKQKAKAHKKEVMKGCGKQYHDRGLVCNCGDKIYGIDLCPTCQAIIDKYSENGI